jgi:hypothetical protein
MLSKKVGEWINCKDAHGRKQGWWIYYKVEYNPEPIPDVLDSGNYINAYRYGKYNDDQLVGEWKEVFNVHQIFESRVDSHFYTKDTLKVISTLFRDKFTTIYIGDSAIHEYERKFSKWEFSDAEY